MLQCVQSLRKEVKVTNSVRTVPKPWGSETIWAETDHYVGKVIKIDAGKRLSLQLHEEGRAILVTKGRLRLHRPRRRQRDLRVLEPGESLHPARARPPFRSPGRGPSWSVSTHR